MTPSPPATLIYGCMGLGGDLTPGPVTTAAIDHAAAAVEAALSIGVSVFDHADIYRFGKAETVFGAVLKRTPGLRERIQIQTKCGIRLDPDHAPDDLSTLVARVDDQNRYYEINLAPGADPQLLLRRVMETGAPIQRFELVQPSLHQIFLEKVGASGVEEGMSGQG